MLFTNDNMTPPRPLRILILSMEYPPETGGGGIGSYVAMLGPALAARGHEVHVLSCVSGQKRSDYMDNGIRIHRRGQIAMPVLGRLERTSWSVHLLKTAISTYVAYRRLGIEFDVIEYPDWGAEGLVFSFLHTRPLVVTLHTPLPVIGKYQNFPPTRDFRLACVLERIAVHRADVITSPSALLVRELEGIGWLKGRKCEIIPNPVDRFVWHTSESSSARPPIALFVGKIEAQKAPEILAESIGILLKEGCEAQAYFIGRGSGERDGLPYIEWLRRLADAVGGCKVLGKVSQDELVRLMRESRVVVVPSRFDNFPMVAAEAMASGKPVIATTSTGTAEIIRGNDIGRLVPAGDARALADALRPFLEDPKLAREVGERARRFVEVQLDSNLIAAKKEAIYRRAIGPFTQRLRKKSRNFPLAIPQAVGNLRIPQAWRQFAVDETLATPWKHFYLRTANQLLELLSLHPKLGSSLSGARILDAGCTPAVSVLLAAMGADVTLLDFSPKELAKGRAYARLLGVEDKVFCIQSNVFAMPFHKESFDLVWNSGFIEHFDNPRRIVAEMEGLARPEGAVVVLVPNKWTAHSLWIREYLRRTRRGFYWDYMGHERSYSQSELAGLLESAGLQVIACSSMNLRRSLLDDSLMFSRLSRPSTRGILFRLVNLIDSMETKLPVLRKMGFMNGAIGIAHKRTGTVRDAIGADAVTSSDGAGAAPWQSASQATSETAD